MKKSEAISNFLRDNSQHKIQFTPGMEVQVNVMPGGEKNQYGWTDGIESWYNFRLMKESKDTELHYELDKRAFAIGLTGWDYNNCWSRWVGYDIDSVAGHSQGLESSELETVISRLTLVDWVHIFRSTSGRGYHCFVHFDMDNPPRTRDHHEHAALARSILAKLSALCGYDFEPRVDAAGMVLWVWHKNQAENGYEQIKKGEILRNIPTHWDNVRKNIPGNRRNNTHSVCPSLDSVDLDQSHLSLIHWFERVAASWWWDQEKRLLVCHTFNLQQAHKELKLNGVFSTVASGESGAIQGSDHNCFAVPIEQGGWIVRRFSIGCKESSCWYRDNKDYTTCYYNAFCSIQDVSRIYGGIEGSTGGFEFSHNDGANSIRSMGGKYSIPERFATRKIRIKNLKDDKLLVQVTAEADEAEPDGWTKKGKNWEKVIQLPKGSQYARVRVPHSHIRFLVNNGCDSSWFCSTNYGWIKSNRLDVSSVLESVGYNKGTIQPILGKAVTNHWQEVNEPFRNEYPGKRTWNRNSAQFNTLSSMGNSITWNLILAHCGRYLTNYVKENMWCQLNGIETGEQYLFQWVAHLVQKPKEPLPYLFFYGPQNSGKSTFHEALGLLFKDGIGYVGADNAIVSSGGFNAELFNSVLCFIEETDLSNQRTIAYNRIKNWVTGRTISIHRKGSTPFSTRNTTHWIQVGNKINECPLMPGDTRITAAYVELPQHELNKEELFNDLRKQLPGFLHSILHTVLPRPDGRLNIPVISTGEKEDQQDKEERNDVAIFIRDYCTFAPGYTILYSEFYERMVTTWTQIKVGKNLPPQYPKGMWDGSGQMYVGNIGWKGIKCEDRPRLQRVGKRLKIL